MQLSEVLSRQESIRAELKRIETDPFADAEADGDMVDTLVEEYKKLEERRVPLAARAEQLNLIASAPVAATERPDGESADGGYQPNGTFTQTYRNKRDPFSDMDAIRSRTLTQREMESRAYDAIEWAHRAQWCDFDDDKAEIATRTVQHAYKPKEAARHMLLTGSYDYYEAFRSYLADPEGSTMMRAMTTGTGSLGYMLPFVLDPTIILSNVGSANPYRQVARVEKTAGPTWNGVSSAGINAAFGSESGAATDASPTVAQITMTPQRALAWVYGSYESLEDSDLGTQLPGLFADAKDRLEESGFATGAGTGVLPQGAVTGGTTGNTAAATAYAVADVYTLQSRLGPRFRRSNACTWIGNLAYINKTRQFDTAGGSSFWANLGSDTPERLLGKPIYESTSMSTGTATGSLVLLFGDMNQFIIADRIGMSILYNPMVTAASTANLPTGEAGWYAFWRTTSKVAVPAAIQVLRIQ